MDEVLSCSRKSFEYEVLDAEIESGRPVNWMYFCECGERLQKEQGPPDSLYFHGDYCLL
jgi:hypothetical protein